MTKINLTNDENDINTQSQSQWKPEEIPQLTVDVYRNDNSIFVVSTVAGVSPQDLDISIEENTLYIKGVRKRPYNEDPSNILLEECFWGEFYRELTINEHLDIDNIKATINNGVLTIQIPILQLVSQKKIKVDIA